MFCIYMHAHIFIYKYICIYICMHICKKICIFLFISYRNVFFPDIKINFSYDLSVISALCIVSLYLFSSCIAARIEENLAYSHRIFFPLAINCLSEGLQYRSYSLIIQSVFPMNATYCTFFLS